MAAWDARRDCRAHSLAEVRRWISQIKMRIEIAGWLSLWPVLVLLAFHLLLLLRFLLFLALVLVLLATFVAHGFDPFLKTVRRKMPVH